MFLVLSLIFLSALFFVLGLLECAAAEKQMVRERLLRYTVPKDADAVRHERKSLWREILRQGGQLFAPLKFSERVEEKLAQANLPLRGEEFLFLNLALAFSVPVLLWFLTARIELSFLGFWFFLVAPWLYLKHVRQRRIQTLNNQLADALAVMTNSLRAGYSFLQAMEMVAREMPPPVSDEFGRALREMQLGTATEAALTGLTRRVGSDDLDLLVTALLIQRQIGGNLAEILDNIAETIRERVRIKGEIKTLTAQGRISGLIISLLPLCLMAVLFLINPQYMGILFAEPLGLAMLGVAAFGEVLGILFIRRIVNIQV